MAIENFTSGWTETDPGGYLTITSSRITWTALARTGDTEVSRDATVSYTGDFDVAFTFRIDSASSLTEVYQLIGIWQEDVGVSYSELYIEGMEASGGKVYVGMGWYDEIAAPDQDDFTSDNTTLNIDTIYYARLKRDDDGGAGTGVFTLNFYTTEANRNAETSSALTLTLNSNAQVDLTNVKVVADDDDPDTDGAVHYGYLENLDLAFVPTQNTGIMTPRSGYWGDL